MQTAIWIVSIGNGRSCGCKAAVDSIKAAVAEQFSAYRLYHTYVSCGIQREGKEQKTDTICNMLEQIHQDGFDSLIVQPTYLMHGLEYWYLSDQLAPYRKMFEHLALGEPLLTSEDDFTAVTKAMIRRMACYDEPHTAVCFVGHGTTNDSHQIYMKMQNKLSEAGCSNFYIGTMKGEPSVKCMVKQLKEIDSYQKVVLYPFMTAAGSHVYQDIAGDGTSSWKYVLEQAGYEVSCIYEGLGQLKEVQNIFAAHIKAVLP